MEKKHSGKQAQWRKSRLQQLLLVIQVRAESPDGQETEEERATPEIHWLPTHCPSSYVKLKQNLTSFHWLKFSREMYDIEAWCDLGREVISFMHPLHFPQNKHIFPQFIALVGQVTTESYWCKITQLQLVSATTWNRPHHILRLRLPHCITWLHFQSKYHNLKDKPGPDRVVVSWGRGFRRQ